MPTFGARAHRGAALADQDVAGEHGFTAELLHAETFAVRFAAVTSTAACLFMCHVSLAPTIYLGIAALRR